MKKNILLAACFGISLFASAQNDTLTHEREITLAEAIALARTQSVDAAVALNELKTAYWEYRTFRADLLPEINFTGTLPNYNKSYSTYQNSDGSYSFVRNNTLGLSGALSIDQNIWFTGGKLSLASSLDYIKQLGSGGDKQFMSVPVSLELTQPIFGVNSLKWNRRIEPVRYAEAKAAFISATEQVTMKTITYFFELLLAKEALATAQQNKANSDRLYEVAIAKRKMGQISENDLLQLKLNSLQGKADVTEAESTLNAKMFQLRSFLGVSESEGLNPVIPASVPGIKMDYDRVLNKALERNSFAQNIRRRQLMCMLLTGMMAASMIAGCGNSGNASANAGADTNTDASADAADSSADQSADVTPDTTAANSASAATGDFDNSEYINVVSREDGSGTRGAFIELFGVEEKNDAGEKIDNTTDEAIITNSTDVMLTTVSGDEYSIGYVSLGSLNDSVKAVSIDGAEATVDNIKGGDYTIARPFNIATKGTPSDVAQDFINFIMSADGQAVISDNKYIPVDDGAAAFESNGASGKVVVAGSSSVTPVMEKLKEAYVAVNSGAEIEIQESDSTTGMTAAMDGTCDIGMASRELKDSETEGGLTAAVIAMDGIAVIVNNDNPTTDLSKDTVKGIYTGEITSWDGVTE